MTPLMQWLWIAPMMAALMLWAWSWQLRRANAGIVDVAWAAGMGIAAGFIAATGQGAVAPRLALALLAGLWSARLAGHLWRRVRIEEDGRYRALREHWQGHQGKFLIFFIFQAGLVLLFCLPFLAVGANPASATAALAVGLSIWLFALGGEAVADRQLARFRADPANHGLTCQTGLWRYSRHPNYFFEWCHWFCYVALAWGSPLGWLAWLGPVLMYVFLRWVSGIPFTEQQALRTRGAHYRDYQRRTPIFFPWFPKL